MTDFTDFLAFEINRFVSISTNSNKDYHNIIRGKQREV